MPEYQIPKSQFEAVRNIMIGWYRAGAAEEPKSNSDVERYTSISRSTISRQNKFLTQLGILEKEGQKRKLTGEGAAITEALAKSQDQKAKRKMRPLLESLELTDQLHSIVEMTGPLSEDELLEELASITGHDKDGRAKTGLRAFIHLYEWAGYFASEDGKYSAVSRSELDEPSTDSVESETGATENNKTPNPHHDESAVESVGAQSPSMAGSRPPTSMSLGGGLNITIEISADHSPKDIRNAVIAIREGLQHEIAKPSEDSAEEPSPTILTDFDGDDTDDSS